MYLILRNNVRFDNMYSQGTTDAINDVRNINILKFKKTSGNVIKQAPVAVVVVQFY
jgi:hypothetical protein